MHNDLIPTDPWGYQIICKFLRVSNDRALFARISKVLKMNIDFIVVVRNLPPLRKRCKSNSSFPSFLSKSLHWNLYKVNITRKFHIILPLRTKSCPKKLKMCANEIEFISSEKCLKNGFLGQPFFAELENLRVIFFFLNL